MQGLGFWHIKNIVLDGQIVVYYLLFQIKKAQLFLREDLTSDEMKRMLRVYNICALLFPLILLTCCIADITWYKSCKEIRLFNVVCRAIYLISIVALTIMIIQIALFFANAIKNDFNHINLGKVKCKICVISFYMLLVCLGAASDLVGALIYYNELVVWDISIHLFYAMIALQYFALVHFFVITSLLLYLVQITVYLKSVAISNCFIETQRTSDLSGLHKPIFNRELTIESQRSMNANE